MPTFGTYSINESDLRGSVFLLKGRRKKDSKLSVIGTAFCVALFDQAALLLTAGHNIEGVHALEKTPVQVDPNCPFPPVKSDKLELSEVFVLVQDSENNFHECPVINMTSWNAYDVATLWVKKPCSQIDVLFSKFSIDTNPPHKKTNVCMLGFDKIKAEGHLISYNLHSKIGNISRIFHDDINLGRGVAKKPNIQTNIAIPSGCSGAPLIDLKTSCVVGIASHDSGIGSDSSCADGKSSVFVPILPALGITVPKQIQIGDIGKSCTGFDLVSKGIIKDTSRCHEHIKLKSVKKNGLAVNFEWNYYVQAEENLNIE